MSVVAVGALLAVGVLLFAFLVGVARPRRGGAAGDSGSAAWYSDGGGSHSDSGSSVDCGSSDGGGGCDGGGGGD
jgi:hypothetical protein